MTRTTQLCWSLMIIREDNDLYSLLWVLDGQSSINKGMMHLMWHKQHAEVFQTIFGGSPWLLWQEW